MSLVGLDKVSIDTNYRLLINTPFIPSIDATTELSITFLLASFTVRVAAFVAADNKVAVHHCAFLVTKVDITTMSVTSKVPSTSSSVNCEIFVVSDKRVKPYGSITAHHRENADENTGYVFIRGKVYGIDDVYLGRAKGPYSRVIFAKTYLSKTVVPNGWTNWSYDGSTNISVLDQVLIDNVRRSDWAKELTKQEDESFLSIDFIDGTYWLPVLLQQAS
ncbi:hypothetical protein IGI04_003463 [Brassica rapa subsp. trilocularis]|uniref:pectinesterase n=1 Tax=Brassica rapa subsp. trilocularis TaxID=1813537 RepID=A0ABQ7P0I1_BRACM|nr:hypothetical protein IGI04_003463 [Brassica rapa subsp. trilocularis]